MSGGLADLWVSFADRQCRQYSPLYDRVCREVAQTEELLDMVAAAPPDAHLPNVLLAAVHYLILSGLQHPLADVYAGRSDKDPGPLFVDVCLGHREAITELLGTRHTNTNEVGRSALVGPALTEVASRLGHPLGLVDVGCSAGVNLLCDQYLIDYGPAGVTGPPQAQVRLSCQVVRGNPPIADRLPAILARVGLDRDPIDLRDDDAVRWQLACVWPDTARLERTRIALQQARDGQLHIVQGDAVDALPDVLEALPSGCVPVVVTTWAMAYLPVVRRTEFVEALQAFAADRPVAWISGEGAGVVALLGDVSAPPDDLGIDASVLGLVTFHGTDRHSEVLGFAHPHGRWLDWRHAE